MIPQTEGTHPAWLPDAALVHLAAADAVVLGDGPLVDTVRTEVAHAATLGGGETAPRPAGGASPDRVGTERV